MTGKKPKGIMFTDKTGLETMIALAPTGLRDKDKVQLELFGVDVEMFFSSSPSVEIISRGTFEGKPYIQKFIYHSQSSPIFQKGKEEDLKKIKVETEAIIQNLTIEIKNYKSQIDGYKKVTHSKESELREKEEQNAELSGKISYAAQRIKNLERIRSDLDQRLKETNVNSNEINKETLQLIIQENEAYELAHQKQGSKIRQYELAIKKSEKEKKSITENFFQANAEKRKFKLQIQTLEDALRNSIPLKEHQRELQLREELYSVEQRAETRTPLLEMILESGKIVKRYFNNKNIVKLKQGEETEFIEGTEVILEVKNGQTHTFLAQLYFDDAKENIYLGNWVELNLNEKQDINSQITMSNLEVNKFVYSLSEKSIASVKRINLKDEKNQKILMYSVDELIDECKKNMLRVDAPGTPEWTQNYAQTEKMNKEKEKAEFLYIFYSSIADIEMKSTKSIPDIKMQKTILEIYDLVNAKIHPDETATYSQYKGDNPQSLEMVKKINAYSAHTKEIYQRLPKEIYTKLKEYNGSVLDYFKKEEQIREMRLRYQDPKKAEDRKKAEERFERLRKDKFSNI